MRRASILLIFFITISLSLVAQQTITGKIVDANGLPLAGVNIRSKLSGKETRTGTDGSYRITIKTDDELEFSITGYESQTIRPDGSNPVDIIMKKVDESYSQGISLSAFYQLRFLIK